MDMDNRNINNYTHVQHTQIFHLRPIHRYLDINDQKDMGTGASIKENIRFDQLEVTETLHDFLEDEKSKSHEVPS